MADLFTPKFIPEYSIAASISLLCQVVKCGHGRVTESRHGQRIPNRAVGRLFRWDSLVYSGEKEVRNDVRHPATSWR
jgi:hypothetical protein